ncbi:MAG: hypothetical protein ACUVUB_06870, partial [Candidatus Bathyarchaeia archaeon]
MNSLGLIFLNWLMVVAAGSLISAKMIKRMGKTHFAILQVLTSILLPLQLLLARGVKNLIGVEYGVTVGIIPIFYSSLLILAPICLLVGSQFVLGCKLYPGGGGSSIGRVYIYEASGSAAGGFVFAWFLVHYTNPLEASSCLAVLNLLSALLIHGPTKRSILNIVIGLLLVLNVYVLTSGTSGRLHELSTGWRWRGCDLIHSQDSVYGNVAVTRIDGQLNFFMNGLLMFTSPDPDIVYVEETIHFPMLLHPSPRRVLLIGGGIGGPIGEILKHPVEEVYYIELDPLIIQIGNRYAPSQAFDDPKVKVEYVDGRLFVKESEGGFDVVIVRLPIPSTLQLNRFYTEEFFRETLKIIRGDGLFSVALPSSEAYMSREMRRHNECIHATINRVFTSSIAIRGDHTIYLASPTHISYDPEILIERFRKRSLDTRLLNENYIKYKCSMVESVTDFYKGLRINKDMEPIGCYYNLVLWNVMYYPESRWFFDTTSEWTLWLVIISLSALLVCISTFRRGRFAETVVAVAVLTTGVAGMTFNITLIYAFQSLYGYIYQAIAILTTSFHIGLTLGASTMNRWVRRLVRPIHALAETELAVCAFSLTILLILTALFQTPYARTEVVLLILNIIAGLIVGLELPLASTICLGFRDGGVEKVAGTLYASDLLGACLGTVLAGVFLIPILGIPQTCAGIFVLNL